MVQVLLWLPANTALTSTDNFLPREKCILAGTQCGRHVKQDQCCSENKDLTGWEVIRGIMEASEERCYLSRVLQDYTARLAVLGREHSRAGNSSTMGSGSRSGAWGAARRLCCRCSVSEQSEDGQQAPECLLHYFNNLGFFLSEMGSFFEISEKRVMIWFILKKKKRLLWWLCGKHRGKTQAKRAANSGGCGTDPGRDVSGAGHDGDGWLGEAL